MQPHEGDSKEQLLTLVKAMTVLGREKKPEYPWDVAELLVVAIVLTQPGVKMIPANRLLKILKELLPGTHVEPSSLHVLAQISQDLLHHVVRVLGQPQNLYDS